MTRTILLALALTTAATASWAAAAGLGGVTSGGLAAGSTTVTACDADGVGVTYTTTGGNVRSATVSGIADPGCEGAQLSVTLTSAGASIGSAGPQVVPTDAGTVDNAVTLSVSPQPAAEQVDGFRVSMIGP